MTIRSYTTEEFVGAFCDELIALEDAEEAARQQAAQEAAAKPVRKIRCDRKVPADDILRQLIDGGSTVAEIAKAFAVSEVAVYVALKAAGIALPNKARALAQVAVPEEPISQQVPEGPAPEVPAEKKLTVKRKQVKDLTAAIGMFLRQNPRATSKEVQAKFHVSHATAYRYAAAAGVSLSSNKRRLPKDDQLKTELIADGPAAVSERYDVAISSVRRHAKRLRTNIDGRFRAHNRILPPDDVLVAEFGLFTPREIASRHGVSFQSVLEARVRLNVEARSARMPHAPIPSGITSVIASAIETLHAYRRDLASRDPPRAEAVLADIEQLAGVATAIRTISSLFADPAGAAA